MVADSLPASLERALELFEPQARAVQASMRDGYLDLLTEDRLLPRSPAQRTMHSRMVVRIYERLWRPVVARFAMGSKAPGQRQEQRMATRMLALSSGDRVLDIACGTGSFTRCFSETVGEGLVVGLDLSEAMLAAAARRTQSANVAYLRADACALPFGVASFDAVCCFGALHLFEQPMRGLDEIVRVLTPGGRVALMVTCESGGSARHGVRRRRPARRDGGRRKYGGVVMFGPEEITGALEQRGLLDVEQRVIGRAQFVAARKPA